jgi:hypothetical protein
MIMDIQKRHRFRGRWRSLFQYDAPLVLRLRCRTISDLTFLAGNRRIDKKYRTLIEDYELPIFKSFGDHCRTQESKFSLDANDPERSAEQLGFLLLQNGNSVAYLNAKCPVPANELAAHERPIGPYDIRAFLQGGAFDIGRWADLHKRRVFLVYFFCKEYKNFKSYGPVFRAKSEQLSDQAKEEFQKLSMGYDYQPKMIQITTFSVDTNQAIEEALETFFISKDVFNVANTKYGLDPFDDFLDEAVIATKEGALTLRWKYRTIKIERPNVSSSSERGALSRLVNSSPSFKAAILAFSDCFDHAARRDNQYLLKTLSTGLESLLGPVAESDFSQGLITDSGRIPQLRMCSVLAKVLSLDMCRYILLEINAEFIRRTRTQIARDSSYVYFANEGEFIARGHAIMSDEIYTLRHKHALVQRARRNIPHFLKGISTRIFFDLMHGIIARNLIIHENVDVSNEYLINVLLHVFKTILSMRLVCSQGKNLDGAVRHERNFCLLIAATVYEFNRITGVDENFLLAPPILENLRDVNETMVRGLLGWSGDNFLERLETKRPRLEKLINAKIAAKEFFAQPKFNGHLMI